MGMQFMIGFVQQKKCTFYFSIDCSTLDQKHVATMFTVFQEAKLVTMMDGCSIFGYLCLDTASRKTPNLRERKKKPSSVRVCLWLSRILYVVGDVQL